LLGHVKLGRGVNINEEALSLGDRGGLSTKRRELSPSLAPE